MKQITLREYEQIYAGMTPDIDAALIEDLSNFIQEYSSKGDENILDFANVSFKKGKGKVISVKNYVGVIQLHNKVQIQILPKIDFDDGDLDYSKTKRIFLKMLKTLKEFSSKTFLSSNLDASKMDILDIFISLYINRVSDLVKKGLQHDYVLVQENSGFIKGKVLINENIKRNKINKSKVYCEFDTYNLNRPENRLIKAALIKLMAYTHNYSNKKSINKVLSYFEGVEASINYSKDFDLIKLTREMETYKGILEWTKIFLNNKSFTSFIGQNQCKSLLFPMEKIFESYVGKLVKKKYIPLGYDVSLQDRGYYLFDNPKRFRLRPDIVLRKDDEAIIMDTKWKRLDNNPANDYGISQADMYQMFAYSKKYKSNKIILIYPATFGISNSINYEFDESNIFVNFFNLETNDFKGVF